MSHMTRRDSSANKFDRAENTLTFAYYRWMKPLPTEEGEEDNCSTAQRRVFILPLLSGKQAC